MIRLMRGAVEDLPNPFSEWEMTRLEEFMGYRRAKCYEMADRIKAEFLRLGWELRPMSEMILDVWEYRGAA